MSNGCSHRSNSLLDKLMERQIDIVVQSGVPLPILIGLEAHDRLIAHIAKYTGKPATSTIIGVVEAAKRLGLRRVALANKWSAPMNKTLGEFFGRAGITVAGVAAEVMSPAQFQQSSTADSIELAYELGRAAFTKFPDAEGLYIGGGAWLSQPVCEALEREFGKPAISNQSAQIWNILNLVGCWQPIPGHGKLLEVRA